MGQGGPGTVTVVHRDEGCAVVLRGEFDLACHAILGSTLDDALRRNVEVLVDLSGVTFLDGSCVRELALLLALHGERVVLEGASREVEVSVTACGLQDLVRFGRPRRGTKDLRARAQHDRARNGQFRRGKVEPLLDPGYGHDISTLFDNWNDGSFIPGWLVGLTKSIG